MHTNAEQTKDITSTHVYIYSQKTLKRYFLV